jgi:proteic killer suppression protein
VIESFGDRDSERLFRRERPRRLLAVAETAYRKLVQIDRAKQLRDLGSIPGNRLERLGGDRAGQYSIRVNEQYRICFRWKGEKAFEVEVVDYH